MYSKTIWAKFTWATRAEIRLNAFPDRVFKGSVADISRVLDPNTRSAKVRIVLGNSDGALRPGMYAVATFRSRKLTNRVVVPATAIMRLHDKDWVFRKEGDNRFRKIAVQADGTRCRTACRRFATE